LAEGAANPCQVKAMRKKPFKNKARKAIKDQFVEIPTTAPVKSQPLPTGLNPWISFKNGLILITICSLALAVLTALQYAPAIGWVKGSLYGLLYGVMVWGVFFISQVFSAG